MLMQRLSIRLSGASLLILEAGLFQLIWTPEIEAVEIFLTYSVLTVLLVLAAIGFFFLQPAGWLLAIMTQGVSLVVALFIYFFGQQIFFAQITMASGIFMVLYLNLQLIRSAFHTSLDDRELQ